MIKDIIKIHPNDNVAITLVNRQAGETISVAEQSVTLKQDVDRGHKIALAPIQTGKNIVKYG
ncbi:UxaA family hydrolase, partial [Providencia rettgeri]